jgi:hypothetical protein
LRYPEHKFCWEAWVLAINFLISQNHMIEFMKSNYYDPYIAQYIHPKKAYKVKLKDDKDFIFNERGWFK